MDQALTLVEVEQKKEKSIDLLIVEIQRKLKKSSKKFHARDSIRSAPKAHGIRPRLVFLAPLRLCGQTLILEFQHLGFATQRRRGMITDN